MRNELLSKIYDEFINLTQKYRLDSNDVIEFILSFILFNMRHDLDEEDARVFCHCFYKSMLREIEHRKKIRGL